MHLVDTHQHLWDLQRFPYSWCAGHPVLGRSFLLSDYLNASDGLAIGKTVFMEADVDEPHALDEARTIAALADNEPLICGIVASARPETAGFREHLQQLAELPRVRGIRRVLHTQPDGLSAAAPFAENLRFLPEFGFTFDLCALARQLPVALALVRRCPEVTFILDHCGVPDLKGRAFEPWRAHIAEIARCPNVVCKISGLVAYAAPGAWTVADLRPWFDHVVAEFGWDRVVWGGDWPVCTVSAPLSRWVWATHELTAAATPEQRAALYHRNAERIYRV